MAEKEYIERGVLIKDLTNNADYKAECGHERTVDLDGLIKYAKSLPAAEVVAKEQYDHVLNLAKKMHTWIFLHTGDEQAAYDEVGLTDEDNVLLGYGGKVEFVVKPDV